MNGAAGGHLPPFFRVWKIGRLDWAGAVEEFETAWARPGMNARVEIVSDTRNDILLVPLSAVFGKGMQRWCYVNDGDTWEKRDVVTGLIGDMRAEIKEGLSEGEVVALITPAGH